MKQLSFAKRSCFGLVFVMLMVFVLMGISACSVPGIVIKGPDINPQINPNVNITPPPGATGDVHYIQADDYFVYNEPLGSQHWDRVWLGKMLAPATPETRNMAHFLIVQSGTSDWYSYWVKTRPAVTSDLVIGKEVFFFDVQNGNDDEYTPPESNQEARSYDWAHSRIVDVADAYRGFVLVGGGLKIALNNIRVVQ